MSDRDLYMESKIIELLETDSRMAVARGQGVGKREDVGERGQIFCYKMNEFQGSKMVPAINNTLLYT